MLTKKPNALRAVIISLMVGLLLNGCFSIVAMDRTIIEYDKTANAILAKLILLNIARAHQHESLHFTAIANIAATFNFQLNAGATPALTGNSGGLMMPIFGGTVSENPTISIVPIEGEEFTRRLLTPFQQDKLSMLLRQGTDIDLVLRLIAGEFRALNNGHTAVYVNQPKDKESYRFYRQAVLHLSAIQDQHRLFAEPITYMEQTKLSVDNLTVDQVANLQKDYDEVEYFNKRKEIVLNNKRTGRIVLTNYDPSLLTYDERKHLLQETNDLAENDLMIDIRPGYVGGEWPIHGAFRLRSFYNVLNFIGKSISDEPEYVVEKSLKTPAVSENPAFALGLQVSHEKPDTSEVCVEYNDIYYWLRPETGYQWNREGFRLLTQIFQMTISDFSKQTKPMITIGK